MAEAVFYRLKQSSAENLYYYNYYYLALNDRSRILIFGNILHAFFPLVFLIGILEIVAGKEE